MIWSLRRPGRKYRINERFFGCKTLKTSPRVRKAEVSLDLPVISDSVEEQTDFSCFLSPVGLLNRPRSHWGRFRKLDRSEIILARNVFCCCLKWILETPDHLRDPDLLLTKPKVKSNYCLSGIFVVFVLFNIKFNATVSLNFITIARAKTSNQYASTSTRECFTLFKSLCWHGERVLKSLRR